MTRAYLVPSCRKVGCDLLPLRRRRSGCVRGSKEKDSAKRKTDIVDCMDVLLLVCCRSLRWRGDCQRWGHDESGGGSDDMRETGVLLETTAPARMACPAFLTLSPVTQGLLSFPCQQPPPPPFSLSLDAGRRGSSTMSTILESRLRDASFIPIECPQCVAWPLACRSCRCRRSPPLCPTRLTLRCSFPVASRPLNTSCARCLTASAPLPAPDALSCFAHTRSPSPAVLPTSYRVRCSNKGCTRIFDPPTNRNGTAASSFSSSGGAGGKARDQPRTRKMGTNERPLETRYYDVLGVTPNATDDE